MPQSTCIVWFRNDLRMDDHPALHAAVKLGHAVLPVFVWDPKSDAPWAPGSASCAWLHRSLQALDASLREAGSELYVFKGDTYEVLQKIASQCHAKHVFWNRRYEPAGVSTDTIVKQLFAAEGIQAVSFKGNLLAEPWELSNNSGKPFKVFTPFWKTHRASIAIDEPLLKPSRIRKPSKTPEGLELDQLDLLPNIRWDKGFWNTFTPGEAGAKRSLSSFIRKDRVVRYKDLRNRPDLIQTSRISPHIHFGEVSVRTIAKAIQGAYPEGNSGSIHYLSEIGWREFAHHLLFHFPHMTDNPINPKYEEFPWKPKIVAFEKWKQGQTGIPIIDAGMRELWHTGWMHNRVRMIAGSFLVKNLLHPWQEGAEYFWDTLVDADLASNSMGWQWVAGSGADAAPYFRIFNPVLQSQKFDPNATYIRKWIPELANFTNSEAHTPWKFPEKLKKTNYPDKIVSLMESRNKALNAYETIK
jgi:deoxyribodipyrimidine photo-lyase